MRLQARNNTMELQADVSQSDVMDGPANVSVPQPYKRTAHTYLLDLARTLHNDVESKP
jgi:hypothetical protein